jgi:hypothetical protein
MVQLASAAGGMARHDEGAWPQRPVTEEEQCQHACSAARRPVRISKARSPERHVKFFFTLFPCGTLRESAELCASLRENRRVSFGTKPSPAKTGCIDSPRMNAQATIHSVSASHPWAEILSRIFAPSSSMENQGLRGCECHQPGGKARRGSMATAPYDGGATKQTVWCHRQFHAIRDFSIGLQTLWLPLPEFMKSKFRFGRPVPSAVSCKNPIPIRANSCSFAGQNPMPRWLPSLIR